MPRPASPRVIAAHAAALAPADRPILALLRERVPEEEIAYTLGLDLGWLGARRWAILGRLGEQSRAMAILADGRGRRVRQLLPRRGRRPRERPVQSRRAPGGD